MTVHVRSVRSRKRRSTRLQRCEVRSVAICGVFAPVNPSQEVRASELLQKHLQAQGGPPGAGLQQHGLLLLPWSRSEHIVFPSSSPPYLLIIPSVPQAWAWIWSTSRSHTR